MDALTLEELAKHPAVKAWQRLVGGAGGRAGRGLKKSLAARRAWSLRRWRHGENGRKLVDVRLASRLEGNPPGAWKTKPISPDNTPAQPAGVPSAGSFTPQTPTGTPGH
jgi:hypothetical protein